MHFVIYILTFLAKHLVHDVATFKVFIINTTVANAPVMTVAHVWTENASTRNVLDQRENICIKVVSLVLGQICNFTAIAHEKLCNSKSCLRFAVRGNAFFNEFRVIFNYVLKCSKIHGGLHIQACGQ